MAVITMALLYNSSSPESLGEVMELWWLSGVSCFGTKKKASCKPVSLIQSTLL